jgi:transcriptional regulatory protein LevR
METEAIEQEATESQTTTPEQRLAIVEAQMTEARDRFNQLVGQKEILMALTSTNGKVPDDA